MTTKADTFRAFLQSIGGIHYGHRTDTEPVTDPAYFECAEGWYPLLQELMTKLVALGWDRQATQIKEKFGGLRIYANGLTEEMDDLVCEYAYMSREVCEDCGEPGHWTRQRYWIRTLCDKCEKAPVE